MTKKAVFRVVLALMILLLLLAAGAGYIFIPKKAAEFPEFSPMPMDTAGFNLIGNLPENLEAGGFMAGQSGWIYYTNFADGGALYMCRENGDDMAKVTDFPVCNINVLGTSLVFTSFEWDYHLDGGSLGYNSEVDTANFSNEWLFSPGYYASSRTFLGGRLYAVNGINSRGKPVFIEIDPKPDSPYFSPVLDRDGLYVTYSDVPQCVLVNKFNNTAIAIPRVKEYLERRYSSGDTIYIELFKEYGENANRRIMRIDAKTLSPIDYIKGRSLRRSGNGFCFLAEDGFIYEMIPSSGEIKLISSMPVNDFEMNQFGEISTYLPQTDYIEPITISKEQRYRGIAQTLMSRRESKPITLQNGWYNYFNDDTRHNDRITYFKANDKYYGLDSSGWSAPWLNIKLDSKPLVSVDDMNIEETYTPDWLDYAEDAEPIDPASTEDFGSEKPTRAEPDGRVDAANDAQNALDAAILFLLGDESIVDKYTAESVEKLRNRYGGAFNAVVGDTADEISDLIATGIGVRVNPQEMREILPHWLKSAMCKVDSARIASSGDEADVTLTVMGAVDLNKLYSVAESEFSSSVDENSEAPQMSAQELAAWKVDMLVEIMKNPEQYGFIDNDRTSSQIRMVYSDCWITENPSALVHVLIRGMD